MLSVNQIARFLNQLFLQNKLMKQSHFICMLIQTQKLKVDRKIFGCTCSKMGVANLVSELLKLTVSEELADGIN